MDVVNGILDEAVFAHISDAGLAALGNLLNDKLSARILNYINSPDGDTAVKERILGALSNQLYSSVFHEEVKSREVLSIVEKLSLDSLANANINVQATIDELQWLADRRDLLRSFIPPRQKADYVEFKQHVAAIQYPAGVPHYDNVIARLDANQSMFYTANERGRSTGMLQLIRRADEWLMALKGLKYKSYCDKVGFVQSSVIRKEF